MRATRIQHNDVISHSQRYQPNQASRYNWGNPGRELQLPTAADCFTGKTNEGEESATAVMVSPLLPWEGHSTKDVWPSPLHTNCGSEPSCFARIRYLHVQYPRHVREMLRVATIRKIPSKSGTEKVAGVSSPTSQISE